MIDSMHSIEFRPSGRGKARCAPDPLFPNGKDLDVAKDETSCTIKLPYPAKECGIFIIECSACGLKIGVTAAGRPDDAKTVKVPCKTITEIKH